MLLKTDDYLLLPICVSMIFYVYITNIEDTSRLYGSILRQILDGIRDQMPTGVFGLPPLDPFEMEFFETLDIDNNMG